jgi:GT2 family glycosyltransferase
MISDSGLRFSIIIPTHNRHLALKRCLEGIARAAQPTISHEVIVVDDGSATLPEAVIAGMESRLNVRLLRQPNCGPGSARNRGAQAAKGTYLVFIDDDCAPDSKWLTALDKASVEEPEALLGGPVENQLRDNLYAETTQLIITFLREVDRDESGAPKFFSANNLAAPSHLFRQLGGFDSALRTGEDRELCYRWRAAKHPIVDVPQAVVFHWQDLDWKGFWKLHVSYGRGSAQFRRLTAGQAGKPFRIEGWRYYMRMLVYPFSCYRLSRALPISGLLLVSQLAAAVGYVSTGRRGKLNASEEATSG